MRGKQACMNLYRDDDQQANYRNNQLAPTCGITKLSINSKYRFVVQQT